VRFDTTQRLAHAALAVLMIGCLATAAALSIDPVSVAVGHRHLVRTLHLWCGYLLPVPVVLALLASRSMRRDVQTLDRFTDDDRRWLRARDRCSGRIPVGKFNAGQKLNAAVSAGAVIVMVMSGSVMLDLLGVWPLQLRTGATFVHDWVALGLFLLVGGHVWYALRDPEALHAAVLGTVSEPWAEREHPLWLDETRTRGPADLER
jgi:formate dehydrogenase subunit gamma